MVEINQFNYNCNFEFYEATLEHPFWTEDSGWVTLEYLKVGDQLRLADGSAVYVAEVSDTGRVEEVYNFAVEGFHTYYFGELGIWVHYVCAHVQPFYKKYVSA